MKTVLTFLFGCVTLTSLVVATTFNVWVGGDLTADASTVDTPVLSAGWVANKFFPSNISLNLGDTIVFILTSYGHSITYSYPRVEAVDSSGRYNKNILPVPLHFGSYNLNLSKSTEFSSGVLRTVITSTYNLTFSTNSVPGTYSFYDCTHPVMTLNVTLNPAGTSYDLQPNEVYALALNQLNNEKMLAASFVSQVNQSDIAVPKYNGKCTYKVKAGQMTNPPYSPYYSYMRFSPYSLNISVGDSVEFSAGDLEGRTILFNGTGFNPVFSDYPFYDLQSLSLMTSIFFPQATSVDMNEANSKVFRTTGTIVPPPLVTPISRFTTATFNFLVTGVFVYVDAFHFDYNTKGIIFVSNKTSECASFVSSTGSAVTSDSVSLRPFVLLLIALLLIALFLVV